MLPLLSYGLLWLTFGVVHTVMAGGACKQILSPLLGSHYRLVYNIISVAHLLLVFVVGHRMFAGYANWEFGGLVHALLLVVFLLGVIISIKALKEYDLSAFAGIKTDPDVCEPLVTDGLHEYVRHPLYCGTFLVFLGLSGSPFGAATAFFVTLYLLFGLYSEERKLVELYGDSYRKYQQNVPAFIPWRGRTRLPNC